jgi:hypothetical protein
MDDGRALMRSTVSGQKHRLMARLFLIGAIHTQTASCRGDFFRRLALWSVQGAA